jgi:hypothetical protein
MLGRKDYTQEDLDHARAAVDQQLAAHKTLVNLDEQRWDLA